MKTYINDPQQPTTEVVFFPNLLRMPGSAVLRKLISDKPMSVRKICKRMKRTEAQIRETGRSLKIKQTFRKGKHYWQITS